MLTVSYFSAGVSSAVATKLMIGEIDRVMYTHIDDQHPDTMRFVKDCEAWFGKPVEVWQSPLKSVDNACRYSSFIRSRQTGATCTKHLKRFVRKEFEAAHRERMRIVWGMDVTERERCERIENTMIEFKHAFPLVERGIDKAQAHEILRASGIRRPAMYELGYHNNNCVGCVKGGMGYWNRIRVDFPEVFSARAKLERDIGFPILGKDVWLDELDPERGRHEGPICDDCGIMCELMALPPSGGDGMANMKLTVNKGVRDTMAEIDRLFDQLDALQSFLTDPNQRFSKSTEAALEIQSVERLIVSRAACLLSHATRGKRYPNMTEYRRHEFF